jgi:GNAT superfamily N-acetyltransferase
LRPPRPQLESLLVSLNEASRLALFNSWTSDAQLRGHAEQVLSRSAWIVRAFVDERLRGVLEICRDDNLGFAEAAFAVEPQWRRRGIGTLLLHGTMEWCRKSGPPLLRMVFCRRPGIDRVRSEAALSDVRKGNGQRRAETCPLRNPDLPSTFTFDSSYLLERDLAF